MIEKAKSGIQLRKIVLIKSEYIRENYLSEPNLEDIDFNVSTSHTRREKMLDVKVDVTIQAKEEVEGENFYISVSMLGTFEEIGEVPFSEEQFVRVNGPAITYPYIRQHVRSLTLESGITPIVLPIINFQAWYDTDKSKEN